MMWGWHGSWVWLWMPLLGVSFWALLVWGGVMLVRVTGRRRRGAHDVLDERFARGEIDEREYRRRREALGEG